MIGILNLACYAYRRNNWIFDWRRYFGDVSKVTIDRPIFLLGIQGGGLTLVSRMLRRNEQVVSVTGDHRYWSGADEMQNVLGAILPAKFSGISHHAPPDEVFDTPRAWTYATDRLVSHYRNTAESAGPAEIEAFQKVIRWTIARHGGAPHRNRRFVDKSQLYTINVGFINATLDGFGPRFLLISRNPYAVCQRYATTESAMHLKRPCSFEQRIEYAAQHWANSMRLALEDGEKVPHFAHHRFEDFINEPRKHLQQICEFVELKFSEDMLPQPEHQLPFGTTRTDRWYPIRSEVNSRYIDQLSPRDIETIERVCGQYARKLGYPRPDVCRTGYGGRSTEL